MRGTRFFEVNHHIPKLKLLEIYPLYPFLLRFGDFQVFDVGANTGMWSEGLLDIYGDKVAGLTMFEPLPGNLDLLERRRDAVFPKGKARLEIVRGALGAETGEVEIHFENDVSGLASIRNTESDVGARVVELNRSLKVRQSTVDAELERLGIDTLHLMKIDVEGYEMNVLRGAEAALRAGRIRTIFFELGVHQRRNGELLRDFYAYLEGFGYKIYKSHRGPNFFGTALMPRYSRWYEPPGKAVTMVLASLDGPVADYPGPRVVTRTRPREGMLDYLYTRFRAWALSPDRSKFRLRRRR